MSNEYQQKWQQCLQIIRDFLKERKYSDSVYSTWFGCITFENYDPQTNTLLVVVPNNYVYEFIEQFYVRLMTSALEKAFGQRVILQYRLPHQKPSVADVAAWVAQHGYNPKRDPYHLHIENARERMEQRLRDLLKERMEWREGYDRVAAWLADNRGRGLLCIGEPDAGKTFLCQDVLPAVIGYAAPVVEAKDLHKPNSAELRDDLKTAPMLIIDNLGKDPTKVYGQQNNSFFDLLNNAERTGQLLIICTNLSTTPIDAGRHPDAAHRFPDSIAHRYERGVLDRLVRLTLPVIIKK